MIFKKLPSNSKRVLDDLVNADNPTQYLSDRFDSVNGKEDEELRSLLRELREEGYITIPMWADNKPYNVILNNSAKTYNERLAEYEAEKQSQRQATYVINDNSVKIGDGAKITKSTIAGRIDKQPFISEERSKELIDVLGEFCSENQAKKFKREVVLVDRVKTLESKTLYTINAIREAMEHQRWPSEFIRGRKISFYYTTHSVTDVHKLIDKHDGKRYKVSPYKLAINDGNYYMIGMEDEAQDLRTYRIGRMRDVCVLDEKQNKKLEWTAIKDMKAYMRQTFSMFGGEKKKVEMRFDNTLLDTVIDKFGVGFGAEYSADGENHFIVTTDVTVSDQFYAWVCGFGTKVKIVAPEDLAKNYKEYLCHISGIY